jgi:hypothetical protein
MGLFDRFRGKKKQKPSKDNEIAQGIEKSDRSAEKTTKSDKELATERGEPYVSILGLEVDPDNLHQGSFELDWNSIFVTRLVRAGYMMKETDTDADIVDRWFQNVCRHVVMETWEQAEAMNPQRFVRSRDLGDGRREHS